MSSIGVHGLVFTGRFDAAGIERAITGAARAGFDLIEFPVFDPGEWDVDLTRALLAEHGLQATASLGLPEDRNVSSADPRVAAAGESFLSEVVDVVAGIGGTRLCGVIYGPLAKRFRAAEPEEVANGQAALGRVARAAAARGVRLSIEIVNRYETNIVNTAVQAVRYVDGIEAPVGIHLDTYHMNIEEPDMFSPVFTAGDRLDYVHIGESHRGYLGTGTVDFDSFFHALDAARYDGPIVFESFSSAVVSADLTGILGIWRNLWDDGDDLAAHANAYIRGALRAAATIRGH
ncbi:sugar phosphate isomerase/epimerase [Pseudolysinimonas kribbensis]|uniref:Epimerase n=1 Tax=Pseudolysinimonas kribbensis TaxID=433641 RepID=A0ABQ6K3G2_9MICO|nr:sugar phosphate isomerase/epimerase family protein [Pseudolysinimonas kribbensis]GMA94115.1 epimerase [Pseudolysinimonas kribbensis]